MRKKISVGIALSFVLIAIAVTFSATTIYSEYRFDKMIINVQQRAVMYERISQIDDIVRSNYFGTVDDDTVLDGMAEGYVQSLPNDAVSYVTADEIATIESNMAGNSVGIGIVVEKNATGYAVVKQVVENSAADKLDVEKGDIIVRVDSVSALEYDFSYVESLTYGTEGDRVNLTFSRDGVEKTVDIVYTEFERPSISSSEVNGYMYIRFIDFNSNTSEQFSDLVNGAEVFPSGIIIDLRDFDGGYCTEAVEGILSQMMPAGTMYSGIYASGELKELYVTDESGNLSTVPCTVLINENTKGLAELLATVLASRDYCSTVGINSFGDGALKELFTLSDGSGIYVAVCKFVDPLGNTFHQTGVTPDFITAQGEGFVLDDENLNILADLQLRKACQLLDSGSTD